MAAPRRQKPPHDETVGATLRWEYQTMRCTKSRCLLVLAAWTMTGSASFAELIFDWTNRNSAGFDAAEAAVMDAAFQIWRDALPTPEPRTMALDIARAELSDAAASAYNFRFDQLGNPSGANIKI